MGFGALRVLNDDRIAPEAGFPTHSHRDMEIVTVVTRGTLTHADTLGNTGTLKAGEVQVMSAGTGIAHSEYNASPHEFLELFQIWIFPERNGMPPRYAQRRFPLPDPGTCVTLAGPEGSREALPMRQNAYVIRATADRVHPLTYSLHGQNQGLYCFVMSGTARTAGEALSEKDAIGLSGALHADIETDDHTELLIIETPIK